MTSAAEFKSRDAASYDDLAGSFDRHTERYSTYVVDRMLALAEVRKSSAIIDIGCGSGIVALTAAPLLPAGARLTGIDLSPGMLDFARAKATRLGLGDRVDFVIGDAEALDLAEASIDTALSLYAWRHLPNPGKAAAEVFRVLRPGGRFVVAVGSGPSLLSAAGARAAAATPGRMLARWRGLELAACDHIDGLVERLLPKSAADENAAWTGGHHAFSGSLAALVATAGFSVESSGWLGREYEIGSGEDFWDLQATFSSTARKRIAAAAPAQAMALRAEFDAECTATRARGGRLVYRVGAAVVSAVKP